MPLIIKPEGLFHGERLHRCSTEARLWWPYFFIASNNCARLRVHYPDFLRTVFAGFNPPPPNESVARYFEEYLRNYLAFLYQTESGEVWAQWDTESTNYLRFQKEASRTSPAPPQPDFDQWRAAYRALKGQATAGLFRQLPLSRGDAPSVTESHSDAPSITEGRGDSPPKIREVKGREVKGRNTIGAFAPPEWIPAEAWGAFEEMRRKLRKPLTDRARSLTVRELEKLRAQGHAPLAVLEQSIQNGWQGVFPLRAPAGNGSAKPRGAATDASQIARERRARVEQNHA